jgi:ubiquinone/menaquinone biosynthesis C-methylase UbiE
VDGDLGLRAERFDGQAFDFDRRAGVGADVGRAVARAVLDLVPAAAEDVVVEIGAGTGEIGRHLGPVARYVGVDSARSMLEVFRSKLPDEPWSRRVGLLHCDAERPWPVRDGIVAAVLASRVAHLLHPGHVTAEVRRVCRPGGVFVVGRVQRDPASPKSRLRRRREALLRDRGLAPRGGAHVTDGLLARLVASGATRLGGRTVASWISATSPDQVLAAWEAMTTMGGIELPEPVRAAILEELRDWARRELGDLQRTHASPERYVLDGVRLGPHPGRAAPDPGASFTHHRPSGQAWTTRC